MAPFIGNLTLEHQGMIETLIQQVGPLSNVRNILVALADELELFQRNADDAPDHSREMQEYQVALQMWEAAYQAAGGKIDD